MSRRAAQRGILLTLFIGAIAFFIFSHRDSGPPIATVDVAQGPPVVREEAALCPWRSPEADRRHFFPASTGYRDENLVLSRYREEITHLLGHPATGVDNILLTHRIIVGEKPVGIILTRAVRGESGVIELVLAVGEDGMVLGAKLQRLREPDAVAQTLQSPVWLGAFRGKTARAAWQMGKDIPAVPPVARISADALLDGVHTLLVLLEVGRSHEKKPPLQHKVSSRPGITSDFIKTE